MAELYRSHNLEVSFGQTLLALDLSHDHNGYETCWLHLALLGLGVHLRVPKVLHGNHAEQSYGFSVYPDTAHFRWNEWSTVLWWPWTWSLVKRWEAVQGDHFAKPTIFWIEMPLAMMNGNIGTKWVYDYTYTRENGAVQHRKAEVYVQRTECRWKGLAWLPFPRRVVDSIWVKFDGEVGEGEGSWKGGTVGCGYDMLPGESPEDTLRRMERERKFSR